MSAAALRTGVEPGGQLGPAGGAVQPAGEGPNPGGQTGTHPAADGSVPAAQTGLAPEHDTTPSCTTAGIPAQLPDEMGTFEPSVISTTDAVTSKHPLVG